MSKQSNRVLWRTFFLALMIVGVPGLIGPAVTVLPVSAADPAILQEEAVERYIDTVHAQIVKAAQGHQVPLNVDVNSVVLLSINRYGGLRDVQFVRSSDNKAVKEEVMRIVASAGPFPPLPAEYNGDTFELEVPVVLHDSYPGCV